MCSLWGKHSESSFHLFFQCSFALKLWSWLAGTLNKNLHFNCLEDIWKLCDLSWSPQCKLVVKASIINLLNIIWYARNQIRFNNKSISWRTTLSMIISNTSLSGNQTKKVSNNSIRDFTLLKNFKVNIHNPRAPQIKEIIWKPPLPSWF